MVVVGLLSFVWVLWLVVVVFDIGLDLLWVVWILWSVVVFNGGQWWFSVVMGFDKGLDLLWGWEWLGVLLKEVDFVSYRLVQSIFIILIPLPVQKHG